MLQRTENNKNEKNIHKCMTYNYLIINFIQMIHYDLMEVLHHDYEWLLGLIS